MDSRTLTVPTGSTFLTSNTFVEKVDQKVMDTLLASDHLLLEWTNRSAWFVDTLRRQFQNEKKQISDYAFLYNEDCEGVIVRYDEAKGKCGRVTVHKSLGFTNMRRPVRHTICTEYYDFDIKNCQPNMLYYVLKERSPRELVMYINDRESIINLHMEMWNIKAEDKWLVKQLFIRLFFMGTFDGYRADMKEYGYNIPIMPSTFIEKLEHSLVTAALSLKDDNPHLWKVAYNRNKEKGKEIPTDRVVLRTFMALFLQTLERRVVEAVMQTIHATTSLMKREKYPGYIYTSYEYDGFKLLKENVDKYEGGKDGVVDLIVLLTNELSGMPLSWTVKEMDEGYDLSEVSVPAISMKELMTEMKMCMSSHRLMAEVIKARLAQGKYIFEVDNKQWYTFDTDTKSWEASDFFFNRDLGKVMNLLYNHPPYMKDQKYKQAFEEFTARSGSSSWVTGVEKQARYVMFRKTVEFDMDTDIINFSNGIYDISTRTFRERTMEDFVVMSTNYDYAEMNSDDIEYKKDIMYVLEQIHPEPDDLLLNLLIMASGLSGRNLEKFFVFNGSGRNGKSLLNSAMKIICGDYYGTCNTAIITEDLRKKGSSEANSAMVSLSKIRYGVFREPPKHLPIQNSTVKDLTGGGEIVAREIFKKVQAVLLHLTMILETNSKPDFAEQTDDAEAERVIDYHFKSHFTADEKKLEKAKETGSHVYPLRTELKDRKWWIKRRTAFLHILLDHLDILHKADYKIANFVPDHVKKRSQEYCESSILVVKIFNEMFEHIEEQDGVPDFTLAVILGYIRDSDLFRNLPSYIRNNRDCQPTAMKNSLEKYLVEKYDCMYEKRRQRFVRGFRRKEEEMDAATVASTSDMDILSEVSTDILH